MTTGYLSEADQIACWPKAWRDDFLRQNELLRMDQDDPLDPSEYLQCRFEDRCEVAIAEESDRAQRHHEVFRDIMQVLMTSMHDSGSFADDVAEARTLADLAYPKPKAKP